MDYLNWDLDVLNRATSYANLTRAAANMGLSQPQLSRIIAKLETDLGVSLLNRDSKRKSTWTQEARKLADIYRKTFIDFKSAAQKLGEEEFQKTMRIGVLEGLLDHALQFSKKLFQSTGAELIELDVYDLPDLEEKYFAGHLDLIFTLREPGKKNPTYSKILGYQTIQKHGSQQGIEVLSLFEHINRDRRMSQSKSKNKTSNQQVFVSNSLLVRERWIHEFGGHGTLPSKLHLSKKNKGEELPAFLIGNEHLGPNFGNSF